LNASTSGQGNAGSVTVNVGEQVSFDGVGSNGVPSSALSNVESGAIGNAGNINITAGSLLVTNGARLESLTRGQGNAGTVTVNADTASFDGGKSYGQELSADQEQGLYSDGSYRWFSGAYTSVEGTSSKGEGGNIIITTGLLSVTDGAQVSARSIGSGAAGNMTVNARSIRLNNNALLSANTQSLKVDPNREQATININSQSLIMRRNSNILTNATGENVIGGNINVNSDIIAALENSDISANSANFRGGRVTIKTQGIFGTQFRNAPTPKSDITATGASPELSGTVEINIPDIDPNSGLVNLPAVPVDTSVAQTCTAGGTQAQSSFIITGRGGLPPNPKEALSSDDVVVNWVPLNPGGENRSTRAVSTKATSATPAPLVEAQGWVMNEKGQVVLTASTPTVTPHSPWKTPNSCGAPQSEARSGA
jgi:large exoprotein involved in heme utilization and adhesion